MEPNIEKSIDVYSLVTNRIIELLEQGTVPWQQSWTDKGIPRNFISNRPYRGINNLLLNSLPYDNNRFLTLKQIKTADEHSYSDFCKNRCTRRDARSRSDGIVADSARPIRIAGSRWFSFSKR